MKLLSLKDNIRKNIFASLFGVHNTISLSRHEQVCLIRLRNCRRTLAFSSLKRRSGTTFTLKASMC